MNKVLYTWKFNFNGQVVEAYTDKKISDMSDGFWINAKREFALTKKDRCDWIPPSQHISVRKGYTHC